MIFDMALWEKSSCADNEKLKLVPVINTLVALAGKSRRDGLLSLEDVLDDSGHEFIKKGLQLVIDGTDPEIVSDILMIMIQSGNFSGMELLERMVSADGIMCIQSGYRIDFLAARLYAYLGENFKGDTPADSQMNFPVDSPGGITPVDKTRTLPDVASDENCFRKLSDALWSKKRLLSTEPVSSEEVHELVEIIESSSLGVDIFIRLISEQPVPVSKILLNSLREHAGAVYDMVMEKWLTFEHLLLCEDKAIQKIMREIETYVLAKAIKGASAEMQQKIYSNMSKRSAALLKEDVEYMGQVLPEDVEEARNRIMKVARELQQSGDIVIPRNH